MLRRRWYSKKTVGNFQISSVGCCKLIITVLELDIQIVGSEAVVFTNPDGKAIHTISATLGSLDGEIIICH
jgi:hypothetical protein